MLKTSLRVLGSQRRHLKGNVQAQRAYREGIRYWQEYYGRKLIKDVRAQAQAGDWKNAVSGAFTLVRYYPGGVASKVSKRITRTAARVPKRFAIRLSR
jgi:hypothetical protein